MSFIRQQPYKDQSGSINNGIPRYVQYTSPVSLHPQHDNGTGAALPLNIVAHIVSFLDEPADLASVTRTCRLLYYMTLPSLYTKVSLRSHSEIRYVDGRPEGFGSGSPFLMALNGLVTGNYAGMVKELRLWGGWREPGEEEFAKGRVPDNSVMLSIIARAVIDRMAQIETLVWQLDTKPLKTLYQGLAANKTLTSLTLKFPSTRDPRPSVMIPPIANLRKFKATDIDPLCYPDDISMLLFGSKKLEDLRLHFSPRMRREAESSLNIDAYFGRCLRAGYQIPLKHFGMQNFYGASTEGMDQIANVEKMHSITFFDVFGGLGGSHGGSRNIYIDATWETLRNDLQTRFKSIRCNEKSPQQVGLLSNAACGLENIYFVNARCPQLHDNNTNGSSIPSPPDNSPPSAEVASLGKKYLYALTRHHGASLKRVLLSDQWKLTQTDIGDLVRFCPNLEQLGLSIGTEQKDTMRLLAPFLPKLVAVWLLPNDSINEQLRSERHEIRMQEMSQEFGKDEILALKWIGIGDCLYRVGEIYSVQREDGSVEWRREVLQARWEDAKHVEILAMDCLDLDADPVARFSP